jgi:PAS domain S-box-containing protein
LEPESAIYKKANISMNVITQFPVVTDRDPDLRFQVAFESVAIGMAICQLDGRILEANPALSRMLGYSNQELSGAHAGELFSGIGYDVDSGNGSKGCTPDERLIEQRLLAELLRGKRGSFEIEKRCRRKDGTDFWAHLTVSLGRDARPQPAFLIAILADATDRRHAEEQLHQAEKLEVLGRMAGGVAHDVNNLLTGILLDCDLLSAELEKDILLNPRSASYELANAGLPNSEVASLALATQGPANPCSECSKNLESARRELSQHVDEVRTVSEQGAAMAQQLLAIVRKQTPKPCPIAINEIVASMQNLLRRLIGGRIELVTALRLHRAGVVLADPTQMRQILLNLVLNARDAMPQGGKITVITRATEFPKTFPRDLVSSDNIPTSPPGLPAAAISLAVKDNGCGMDAENAHPLFEPFFTTKKPGQGTGLGLATVQRIVSQAGGVIEVESEPGHGTLMEVFLRSQLSPGRGGFGRGISDRARRSTNLSRKLRIIFRKHPRQKPSGLTARRFIMVSRIIRRRLSQSPSRPPQIEGANFLNLLIVDDDRTIREACREVAQSLGFNAQVAESAEQALLRSTAPTRCSSTCGPARRAWKRCTPSRNIARRAGNRGHRLWHGAVGGAGHERWRLRLRHQTLQHGRTALAAGAGRDHLRLKTENRVLRETIKSRQGLATLSGARPRWKSSTASSRRRPEHASRADSGRKRHRQGVGGQVDSLRRLVPQQTVHSSRLRLARADSD